jgi:hypothetical protein
MIKAKLHCNVAVPNENKMSDGGRGRASLGLKVWKSSQKWSVRRSAVRSIAWLGPLLLLLLVSILILNVITKSVSSDGVKNKNDSGDNRSTNNTEKRNMGH